jgi:hypothetical protein
MLHSWVYHVVIADRETNEAVYFLAMMLHLWALCARLCAQQCRGCSTVVMFCKAASRSTCLVYVPNYCILCIWEASCPAPHGFGACRSLSLVYIAKAGRAYIDRSAVQVSVHRLAAAPKGPTEVSGLANGYRHRMWLATWQTRGIAW